jgi:hypothetical protein
LPIFGEKIAFSSKPNVTIKFLQNLALFRVENANCWRKYLKTITSVPGVAKKKVAEEGMDMLRDHWPYNEDELVRLCDLCFGWKADGRDSGIGREVLLVGSFFLSF